MLRSNLLQNRRGLTAAVGTIFFVVIATSIVGYVTYSTNVITIISESVQIKQTINYERNTEEFEVVKVGTVFNKFNFTLQNTGNIPVNVTRLWVQNTTDSAWPASKFNINTAIAPGATITNVGQNIGLTALSTQSYLMKLVTERGSSQKLILNSVGEESLYLKLHAAPTVVATGFTTTLILEVINTGTSQLLNLQAEMDSVTPSCGTACATLVSGPDPATFSSLDLGDVATFEWVYSLTGDNGDQFTFTASLVNGIDTDSTTVSVQAVQSAENSDVSLTAAGINIPTINDSILVFHQETFNVPASTPPNITYQMYSATPDGGVDGTLVQLDTVLLSSFFTKNGTDTITIPAGKWNASLYLQSEAMTASLIGDGEDLIFHLEDGDGVNPDNSESSASRDLQICDNLIVFDTFTEGSDTVITLHTPDIGTGWTEVFDSSTSGNDALIVALTDEVQAGQQQNNRGQMYTAQPNPTFDDQVVSITIDAGFTETGSKGVGIIARRTDNNNLYVVQILGNSATDESVKLFKKVTGTYTQLGAYDATLAAGTIIKLEITDATKKVYVDGVQRISSTDNALTSVGTWGLAFGSEAGLDSLHLRPQWHLDDFTAEHLTSTQQPDWQAGVGPHNSGAYYFDGIDDCFESANVVSSSDGNNLAAEPDTTALWFKTDGAVSSEQHLVYWEGGSEYYRISLSNTGKVLFEFNTGGSDTTKCESLTAYDDLTWYFVTAVREGTGTADQCSLYIYNLSGALTETAITQDNGHSTNVVDVDGRWHVGSNKQGSGNHFKGWIDDIIHWNDKALTSTEATDLAKTNYGTGAHQLDIRLDITDSSGTIVSNVYDGPQTTISFQDSKNLGDNNDAGYGIFNVTMNLPQVIISPQQRLNFSMNFVPFTASWIPLELDMKIDDTTLSPFPSYLQMPKPDTPFPSYYTYDNDNEADIFVTNSGNDGIYFVHSYTRINFNGTNGAYAGLIHRVNGTTAAFDVDSTQDSIYIPAGSKAELFFYIPTDQPATTVTGTVIPPGIYRTAIWLHGYTDQGETFSMSVVLGSVNVVE